MSVKYTIEFMREQFEREGYTLVSTEYINAHSKLDYICPLGHEHSICWDNWNRGFRCAKCKNIACSKRLTGKTLPKETKQKISKTRIKKGLAKGKNNPMFGKGMFGENNPAWNPELTEEDRITKRKYPKYKEWTYAVKERDNFTCQVCGDNKGGNLISHHLEGYTANPALRTTLSNGVCLCKTCHSNFHHQYGNRNNIEEQYIEFKEKK